MINKDNKTIILLYTLEDFEKGIHPDKKIEMIEQELKQSIRISEHELPKVFPEAKPILLEKLKEWETIKENIRTIIKKKLRIINAKSAPENRWFWQSLTAEIDGQKIVEIDKHITRLKRLQIFYSDSGPPRKGIGRYDIERIKSIPIEEVLNIKFRRSGNKLFGLCPLHKEKTPSFYIYQKSNSFYCFGCQKGGDIINLIQLLYSYSFVEAVRHLQKL